MTLETFMKEAQKLDRDHAQLLDPQIKDLLLQTAKKILACLKGVDRHNRGELEFELESLADYVIFEFVTKGVSPVLPKDIIELNSGA